MMQMAPGPDEKRTRAHVCRSGLSDCALRTREMRNKNYLAIWLITCLPTGPPLMYVYILAFVPRGTANTRRGTKAIVASSTPVVVLQMCWWTCENTQRNNAAVGKRRFLPLSVALAPCYVLLIFFLNSSWVPRCTPPKMHLMLWIKLCSVYNFRSNILILYTFNASPLPYTSRVSTWFNKYFGCVVGLLAGRVFLNARNRLKEGGSRADAKSGSITLDDGWSMSDY